MEKGGKIMVKGEKDGKHKEKEGKWLEKEGKEGRGKTLGNIGKKRGKREKG